MKTETINYTTLVNHTISGKKGFCDNCDNCDDLKEAMLELKII